MSIDQAGSAVSPKTSIASDSRVAKGKTSDAGKSQEVGFSSVLSTITPPEDQPSLESKEAKSVKEDESLLVSTTNLPIAPLVGELGVPKPPREQEKDSKEDVSLLVSTVVPRIDFPPMGMDVLTASTAKGKSLQDPISLLARAAPTVPADVITPNGGVAGAVISEALIAADSAAGGVGKFNGHAALQGMASVGPPVDVAVVAPADSKLAEVLLAQTSAEHGLHSKAQKITQARQALGEALRADVFNARFESRAVKAASELDLSGKDAMQAKLSLVADFAARIVEPNERPHGKSSGLAGTFGVEAGWSQYAHHARTSGDMPVSVNPVVVTQAQMQVADKVGYWVSQGIQNAELKLEGFGADPVEVSILLKGGEAQVGFRSDQPEVRQMLEGALNQLKDALARDGVVLTGVTVGGSGADGGGGRQPEQRRDFGTNRSGGLPQGPAAISTPRAPMATGRSLDIFV